MRELKKYFLRFGLILWITLPIIMLLPDQEKFYIIAYKISITTIAVGLAELIWAVFFKPVFRKSEDLSTDERKGVLLFRGLLYGAIILSLTLGL